MQLSHDVKTSLKTVLGNISQSVAKRNIPYPVRLVAVSKTKPKEYVEAAYEEGHRHFGENYVNELVDKAAECPSDIKWHFIGHLQSKKCNKLLRVPNLYQVECVESIKLADKLQGACELVKRSKDDPLRVLVQVNTSNEASKSGCTPAECVDIVTHILERCPNLKFQGLMTIGQYEPTPYVDDFVCLVSCKKAVLQKYPELADGFELSMGMSHDYDAAIEQGSTQVRVGTAIFGPRTYINSNDDE